MKTAITMNGRAVTAMTSHGFGAVAQLGAASA